MTPSAVRPIRHLRWWIIAMVMVGTAVNYLARSALGSAAPTLTKELDMSTQAYSYVVAAFQLAYTIVQPLAGWILDVLGAKVGLFVFAIGWSLANMAHALATGWPSLAVYRGLLGVFEGAVIPAGMKAVSDWFPDKERSVATGWFNIGTAIGSMIAPPLVVWCILVGSWRLAFIVTGAVGLVWAALWLAFYRRPQEHSRISPEELAYIEAGQAPDAAPAEGPRRPSWITIARTRNFWAIALPRFLADPAWQTFNFWIPLYLVTVRGMDLKQIAAFAWLPFLAADLGSIFGGYLSPALMRFGGVSLLTARKLTILTGSVLMIGPACIAFAPNAYWAIALFCVGGFAHQILSGALITLSADVFPKHQVATATGMAGTAAWTGGLLFSLLVGALATTIGYNPLFVCLAIFDLIGAALVFSLLRKPALA
ncbi:MFS transporter [Phenylobacterium sp. LjRoot225]|uniref:MFS transporter n=1 Tax=Phenylobacterium sp. LjRoot225 TaxID=3342285 RepID=UPI003ED0AD3A